MKRLLNILILLTSLGCKAHCQNGPGVDYRFDDIEPSANLTWVPCFDGFSCARLEVPLDYANRSLGTTSIAFIQLSGKNATVDSQTIVFIPGGPGGSGIDLLLSNRDKAGPMLGEQYNIVSFDPRGVSNSGLRLDCFSGNEEARLAFGQLHSTEVTNISSTSLEKQYYSSSIYGEWCNDAVENESPHGYYVTTPAVARDLLAFIEADAELAGERPSGAKLWAYGASYGTVIGTTFASLFPDRVGRMVLDGVLDADKYYDNDWTENVDQMNEAMKEFSTLCHSAGSESCSFWRPTPAEITARIDDTIHRLESQPMPLSGVENRTTPTMVTYSDLKAFFMKAVYLPGIRFPAMADALLQLERGDASALAGAFDSMMTTSDARIIIMCADSYRRNNLTSIEDFRSFTEYTVREIKYLGDFWPIFQENVLCREIRPELPDSMVVQNPISALETPTFFPILFASNTIDPITPLKSARKMSSQFAGSALLLQDGVGHTIIDQGGSNCYFRHVQAYFQGFVPPPNTTCPQQYTPFIHTLA